MNYEDVFRKCVDKEEMFYVYQQLLQSCEDLTKIRYIDLAYTNEYNRRRNEDNK